MVTVELPFPPSINHYWRRNGARYFISKEGTEFRNIVIATCYQLNGYFNENQRLSLVINVYPPDKRRRDLDNLVKSVQDSLQHAGVYPDDSQIDDLRITRNPNRAGKIVVQISEII